MIEPIILSKTDATSANNVFNNALTNEPATLMLVIGDNAQSNGAVQKLSSFINSDDHFYNGVIALQAPNISFILDTLKGLKVSPRLDDIDWDSIDSYLIISISNVFNNIGNVVLSSKYDNRSTYYIEKSIMLAMAYDQNLNQ
ncbi:hypothetical protein D1818_01425 [Aquimarina sp. BL5]|uniref:hypothetical protein n=1 Tax=Aquimarina sp. BL5 TaxID=1714860 RepID=UPI000E4E4B79|nr:hypothetical protein [Aquimarina sp. BL5]AXT49543.1 hypothetical protein D1818_01425 [Aquimarina sp. BL5]RKM93431.1 hypothetical protein D7036_22325 [Aquimarina sp. BL5]